MKNRILKQLLLEHGFVHVRSRGDHHVYQHPKLKKHIILTGDNGTDSGKYKDAEVLQAIKKIKRKK